MLVWIVSPHTNLLVGRDGAAVNNKCSAQYVKNWGSPKVRSSIVAVLPPQPLYVIDSHIAKCTWLGWCLSPYSPYKDNLCNAQCP